MFLEDRNSVIDVLNLTLPFKCEDYSSVLEAFWDNPSTNTESLLFILLEVVIWALAD